MSIFGTILPYIWLKSIYFQDLNKMPEVFKELVVEEFNIDGVPLDTVSLVVLDTLTIGWFGRYARIVYNTKYMLKE